MWFILLLLIALWFLSKPFYQLKAKNVCNIPWYFYPISLDIGGVKGKMYSHKQVNGVPDAIFKHIIFPQYIVCELKGRKYKNHVRRYEHGQITLYLGIIKAHYFGSIKGRLIFKDAVIDIPYQHKTFKEILSVKTPALEIINRLHRN